MTKILDQKITENYSIYNGDCIEILGGLPDNSIGYCISSPPFASLYTYSNSERDLGNCKDYADFWESFKFMFSELYRVMKPGRSISFHCIDLPTSKESDGYIGMIDFVGDLIRAFQKAGFIYHSRVVIWKDPLIEVTRTKALGLQYKQICKDSSMCRQGIPDTLITFRKPGENTEFIKHERDKGLGKYAGKKEYEPSKRDGEQKYAHRVWQKYASPVWMDIDQTEVLSYREARDKNDEKHICLSVGSLVLTKELGYIPIETVNIGYHVLTHKGRWRAVLAKQNTGINDTVIVKAQGVPGIQLTPNHKLWMRMPQGTRKGRDKAVKINPNWVEAQYSIDGYVNFKLPKEEQSVIGDNLVWWIIGRWLADGHIHKERDALHISYGYHEKEKLLKILGNYAGTEHDTGTSFQVRLKDRDKTLRNIVSRCGTKAHNKHIPSEAYTLPLEQAKALLDGYISGDGHIHKSRNRVMVSSVSKNLLLGISFLAQRVYGAVPSVYEGRKPRKSIIEGRTVNCKQDWILSFNLPSNNRKIKPFMLDDGAWKKVKSVQSGGKVETWNLRVEEDESYTAEGCIVKNCPLQLQVIERGIVLWSNPGDIVLDPFGGIGSTGYIANQLDRKAVMCELKESYFSQMVKHMEIVNKRKGREFFNS